MPKATNPETGNTITCNKATGVRLHHNLCPDSSFGEGLEALAAQHGIEPLGEEYAVPVVFVGPSGKEYDLTAIGKHLIRNFL